MVLDMSSASTSTTPIWERRLTELEREVVTLVEGGMKVWDAAGSRGLRSADGMALMRRKEARAMFDHLRAKREEKRQQSVETARLAAELGRQAYVGILEGTAAAPAQVVASVAKDAQDRDPDRIAVKVSRSESRVSHTVGGERESLQDAHDVLSEMGVPFIDITPTEVSEVPVEPESSAPPARPERALSGKAELRRIQAEMESEERRERLLYLQNRPQTAAYVPAAHADAATSGVQAAVAML
jgi:hypothetical protein